MDKTSPIDVKGGNKQCLISNPYIAIPIMKL